MAMGLGAAKRRVAVRRRSAIPQARDVARRGAAGGRANGFGRRRLDARGSRLDAECVLKELGGMIAVVGVDRLLQQGAWE